MKRHREPSPLASGSSELLTETGVLLPVSEFEAEFATRDTHPMQKLDLEVLFSWFSDELELEACHDAKTSAAFLKWLVLVALVLMCSAVAPGD